ncbi:hypothetical protein KSP39_PZI015067 [Platanthera zijinensis]|uniref:Uncharacterized protein n=1 Tax=Platanthera zijinensis TaxID=2320716 RepID=A0AAP0BAF2_9ASPA
MAKRWRFVCGEFCGQRRISDGVSPIEVPVCDVVDERKGRMSRDGNGAALVGMEMVRGVALDEMRSERCRGRSKARWTGHLPGFVTPREENPCKEASWGFLDRGVVEAREHDKRRWVEVNPHDDVHVASQLSSPIDRRRDRWSGDVMEVWDKLRSTYDGVGNTLSVFQVKGEIDDTVQGEKTVQYGSKCRASKIIVEERTMKFLRGLNEYFDQWRSILLSGMKIPLLTKTISSMVQEETRLRFLAGTGGSITVKSALEDKKAVGQNRRQSLQSVSPNAELDTFDPSSYHDLLRWGSGEAELKILAQVLDGIILPANNLWLSSSWRAEARVTRKRGVGLIGMLLRKAQPELMDALVQASKEGDTSRLQALTGQKTLFIDDEDSEENEDDLESEEEDYEKYMEVADRWFDGLVYKDPSITNEVYSVHAVDFDRQVVETVLAGVKGMKFIPHRLGHLVELRRLVRRVQSIHEESNVDESGLKSNAVLTKAKKPLIVFLHSLAKKSMI